MRTAPGAPPPGPPPKRAGDPHARRAGGARVRTQRLRGWRAGAGPSGARRGAQSRRRGGSAGGLGAGGGVTRPGRRGPGGGSGRAALGGGGEGVPGGRQGCRGLRAPRPGGGCPSSRTRGRLSRCYEDTWGVWGRWEGGPFGGVGAGAGGGASVRPGRLDFGEWGGGVGRSRRARAAERETKGDPRPGGRGEPPSKFRG